MLVSLAIFGSVSAGNTTADISSVKLPYLVVGAAFIVVAIFLKLSSVPNKINLEEIAAEESEASDKVLHKPSVFQYPQLILGMIGIFVYVGVEVSTASNLPEYLRQHFEILNGTVVLKSLHLAGTKEFTNDFNAPYISLYWASLMMGR